MSKASFKTPRGIAMYPYINKADTQFDSAGKYKVNLRLKKEDAKEAMRDCRFTGDDGRVVTAVLADGKIEMNGSATRIGISK